MAAFKLAPINGAILVFILLSLLHVSQSREENITRNYYRQDRLVGKAVCDYYEGSWVWDSSYPLYSPAGDCPFIEKEFNCDANGRPDRDYTKYRWQPSGCNLPRFNGKALLQRLTGKKLLFVGDSLSLNQWQSLTCMLHSSVPSAKYTLTRAEDLSTFSFPEYNIELMFTRNAFLIDIVKMNQGRVALLDSVEGSRARWEQMDILIFDTWHWWFHTGRKQPWDFVKVGGKTFKDVDRMYAYETALQTWANWVDSRVNTNKIKIFFQGVSPDHSNPKEWGQPTEKDCSRQTEPIRGSTYPGGPHPGEVTLQKVVRAMQKPVNLLKFTTLSQLRKDGHPSIYGLGGHRGMDCTHWCLPGVPDAWNQLLYASLIQ